MPPDFEPWSPRSGTLHFATLATLWICVAVGVAVLVVIYTAPFVLERTNPTPSDSEALAADKTRLEVQGLRYGWLRTLGTALVTVFIAAGGWYLQATTTAQDTRQRDLQAESDKYFHFLGDLGNTSGTARINAAEYLEYIYRSLPPASDIDLTEDASTPIPLDDDLDDDVALKRHQIVQGIVYRFSNEDNPGVREELGRVLRRFGWPNVNEVASANRRAAYYYAKSLGAAVVDDLGNRLTAASRALLLHPFQNGSIFKSTDFERVLTALQETSYASALGNAEPIAAPDYEQFEYGNDQLLPNIYRRAVSDAARRSIADALSASAQDHRDLKRWSASLAATGRLLADLIRAVPEGKLNRVDLQGTFIPFVDLRHIDMSGVRLNNAIVAADLSDTKLDFATLRNASLTKSSLTENGKSVSLIGADISGAQFSAEEHVPEDAFKGSNKVDALFGDRARRFIGENYSLSYARAVQDKRRVAEYAACERLATQIGRECPWRMTSSRGPK
jgi:hypothetical protein